MNSTKTNIKDLTPSIAIHPGEILLDELNSRNIKQKDFAIAIDLAPTYLNEIIKGKRSINADLALIIGKHLDMDPAIWLNLQSNYDLDVAKISEKNRIKLESLDKWRMIEGYIAVKFYKKQGIITGNPVIDILKIKEVYNIQNIDQLASVFREPAYNRKSEKLTTDKINLIAWNKLVSFHSSKIKVEKFNIKNQDNLIQELNEIFAKNNNTIDLCRIVLAKYGIKFIQLTNPEKCAVDGVSFWSHGSPAIGMSVRYKRIDNFAFTLMHELGHIFLHLINDNTAEFIDLEELKHKTKPLEEKEADEFAINNLIPLDIWNAFIEEIPSVTDISINHFAKKYKIQAAIILGRYSFETNNYKIRTTINKTLL